jgi:predicted glycosyltransferase
MRPAPLLISSVRDIVERRRQPEKYLRMAERVERHFHAVLVHSDPELVPFADSFPLYARIRERVHHTGYISDRPPVSGREPRPDGPVLVSAGGGFFGEALLAAAVEAAGRDRRESRRWHVLAGPNLPESRFHALVSRAGPRVTVERNRPDFHRLLDACAVSVSQAGYNTVTDLLASRTPAVLVPYEDEREGEQAVRARHLALRGLAHMVPYATLAPGTLLGAVHDAAAGVGMPPARIDLDGARRSAQRVLEWLQRRQRCGNGCQSSARARR